jgi:hypothetical protein
VSGQLHAPATLSPGERAPGTHWIGGWVCLRTSLDGMEKRKLLTLLGLELRPLSHPTHSQSLYRLRYPSSYWYLIHHKFLYSDKKRNEHGWWEFKSPAPPYPTVHTCPPSKSIKTQDTKSVSRWNANQCK